RRAGCGECGSAGKYQDVAMKAGWPTKKLGDLLEVQNGYAFSSRDYSEAGHFLMRIGNVQNGYVSLSDPKFVGIPSDSPLQRFVLSEGDILVSLTGNVGRIGVIQEDHLPAVLNQRVARIAINEHSPATREFLLFFLYSDWFREELGRSGHGAAQQNVSTKDILEIQLPIPPLPEQQRIVGILDDAFDGIATAKANAEQNLQNARALFESHLQSVFADAWQTGELVTLADLATDITDGDHMPPPKAMSGVPFITIGNVVKDTRIINFTDTFMVSREYFDRLKPNKKPKHGDVLYTVTGSFGIPVLVNEHREFCFQRHIGLVRPKTGVSSEWLYYLLMSPQIFKQANDGATGAAQKTVSLKLLRGFQVPRIPFELQHEIAAKLKAVSEETQRLESLYQRKLAALDELKKSLLHQAFSGQL
ncbi:MAG: restriction endonuclease subunit S, partial [Candidatus Woesebacteria bacterium]|nr:restriction endonuclease subunit S [Candidatus Woesebacteria bacterium]